MHVAFLVALLDLDTACHEPKSVFGIPNTIFSGHLQTRVLSIVLILDVNSVIGRKQCLKSSVDITVLARCYGLTTHKLLGLTSVYLYHSRYSIVGHRELRGLASFQTVAMFTKRSV